MSILTIYINTQLKLPTYYSSLAIISCLFLLNCDSTNSPEPVLSETPVIESLEVDPTRVEFSKDTDGYKDTTITITVTAEIEGALQNQLPVFTLSDKETGETYQSGELTPSGSTYSASIDYTLFTTSFADLLLKVYALDENEVGNYAQSSIEIAGFPNAGPVIIEVSNPDEETRPAQGEQADTTYFTAKVTDEDGQNSIQSVRVTLIDLVTGVVDGSPFTMFDDGESFNDLAANDSTYTIGFEFSYTDSRPTRNYRVLYFAIDRGGLISDTVETSFRISN